MSNKDKDFYVWTMEECIKSTYEWWGTDMMSMYRNIEKDFPNAAIAINKMYLGLSETNFYSSQFVVFEKAQYVYEAIANLIPHHEDLLFDIKTQELYTKYKKLNLCSWNRFVDIKRIDLLMAVLLFTEDFILQPISDEKVTLTDNSLTVDGNFVVLKVSKHIDRTSIFIRIKDVMILKYVIQN